METEKCLALIRAAELGSLSAAAEELGYTPSGISRMMTTLEDEVGFPLLERTPTGVVLTSECERLLPIMRQLVYQAECFAQASSAITGLPVGKMTIGVTNGAYYRWLSNLIVDFCRDHPGVSVSMIEGHIGELKNAMKERRVDFCIISRQKEIPDWISLTRDELVCVVPQNHRFASADAVSLQSLRNEPLIELHPGAETDVSRLLKSNRIKPLVHYSCSSATAAYSMVEAGLGVCLINAYATEQLKGNVKVLSLDPPQYVDIGIAIGNQKKASPVVKCFIKYALETKMPYKVYTASE